MSPSHTTFIFIFATIAIVLAYAEPIERHDLILGQRIIGDHEFVYEKVYEAASKIGQKLVIEKEFRNPAVRSITMIRVLDQNDSGHGAQVNITGGGVGYEYVKLRFKSERFRSIDFIVEIYGR